MEFRLNSTNKPESVYQSSNTKNTQSKKTENNNPLLKFMNTKEYTNISDAQVITENFKYMIEEKLSALNTNKSTEKIKYHLDELIELAQTINGVKKNNLKPSGNTGQNKMFYMRLQEDISIMKDHAGLIGSGFSVVQDAKTGLYKLCIDNKLYDIPERKVEIRSVDTEEGPELRSKIID